MNYKSYALKTIAILMLCILQTCHSGIIKNAIRTCKAHALTAASVAWLGWQGYKYMARQHGYAQTNNNTNSLTERLEKATTLSAALYLVYKICSYQEILPFKSDNLYQKKRAILYKAEKDGNTTYLAGSCHMLPAHEAHPLVQKTFMKSDSCTIETEIPTQNRNNYDPSAMDFAFEIAAKFLKKQSYYLESFEAAKAVPDASSSQTLYDIVKMADNFRSGNMKKLCSFINTTTNLKNLDIDLFQRNKNWIPIIQNIHAKHKNNFIMAGAAHFYGEQGLPTLLRNQGFTVQRMGLSLLDKIDVITTRWVTSWWKK